jgi:hypothetical protein
VYSLLIERLERHVLAERLVAAVFMAAGDKKAQAPVFEIEQAKLDRLLEGSARRERDPEQAALIAALGLGG